MYIEAILDLKTDLELVGIVSKNKVYIQKVMRKREEYHCFSMIMRFQMQILRVWY